MIHDSYSRARRRPAAASAAGFFRRPAELYKGRNDAIAVIALHLDHAIAHRAAGAAALLQLRGERLDIRRRERQSRDRGDALARTALGLAAHAHRADLGRARVALGTHALAHGAPAIGAQRAHARGIN